MISTQNQVCFELLRHLTSRTWLSSILVGVNVLSFIEDIYEIQGVDASFMINFPFKKYIC